MRDFGDFRDFRDFFQDFGIFLGILGIFGIFLVIFLKSVKDFLHLFTPRTNQLIEQNSSFVNWAQVETSIRYLQSCNWYKEAKSSVLIANNITKEQW